jgi:hypothetical protein
MFDKHDEKAREIVNEFFKHYTAEERVEVGFSFMPEPRVWLLAHIARALREAAQEK